VGRFPVRKREFYLRHNVKTGCGLVDGNHRLDKDTAPVERFELIFGYILSK
jgi:hypothetical protein